MSGQFDSWDLVPAVLELAAPATIRRLDVSTLGFNERVITGLAAMLDGGQVEAVRFIAANWFRSVADGGRLFDHLAEMLAAHNQPPPIAVRNHSKVILFEMTDGRHFAIESSANLRSCNNVEVFSITQDAELVRFHRSWMEEVTTFAAQHPTQPPTQEQKKKVGFSVKRAAIGAFSVHRDEPNRRRILEWKATEHNSAFTEQFAAEIVSLIRQWSPTLPSDALITTPPQGASAPGFYFAGALAAEVARQMDRQYAVTLARQDAKRFHHPRQSLMQLPFAVQRSPLPQIILIVDDLITSGTTLRLSIDALRAAGTMPFGFAFAAS
jgi:hypothetical protein